MKFHLHTKIVLGILVLLILAFGILIAVNYHQLKSAAPPVLQNVGLEDKPGKTCSPQVGACPGNPELCLEQNKNVVCN